MSPSSPSPTPSSPVHKKPRTNTDIDIGTDTDTMIPVDEAPVNALFVETPAESSKSTKQVPQPVKGQVQGKKKSRRMKKHLPETYSPADVTYRDVRDFLGGDYVDSVLAKGDESEWAVPSELELWSLHELTVGAFTVSGKLIPHSSHPSQKNWIRESVSVTKLTGVRRVNIIISTFRI